MMKTPNRSIQKEIYFDLIPNLIVVIIFCRDPAAVKRLGLFLIDGFSALLRARTSESAPDHAQGCPKICNRLKFRRLYFARIALLLPETSPILPELCP